MKRNQVYTIQLAFIIFANAVHCFTIDSKDKIASEPGTLVVSDRKVFLPLGWPNKLFCDSADKLEDINVKREKRPTWKIRFSQGGSELVVIQSGSKQFDISGSSLNISPVTTNMIGTIIECIVDRPGNTSLLTRYRVEVQDCKSQSPEDTNAYNLHNPCAYGKCQVVRSVVQCLCFKQYTGRHCDIQKPSSTFLDVLPYFMPAAIPILYLIIIFALSLVLEDRKQEKLMGISELVGHPDRGTLKLANIYPFVRKLRRCQFSEDEEEDEDEDDSDEQLLDEVQKIYQEIKDLTLTDSDSNVTDPSTKPAIKTTKTDAGNTTEATTVDVTGTANPMKTVSGAGPTTVTETKAGPAVAPKMTNSSGFLSANSKGTNKREETKPKQKTEPETVEPIPEVNEPAAFGFPEDSFIG